MVKWAIILGVLAGMMGCGEQSLEIEPPQVQQACAAQKFDAGAPDGGTWNLACDFYVRPL